MREVASVALAFVLGASIAAASEAPLTTEQAMVEVLAARDSKDHAKLKSLAARDDPDPWLVADALCAREEWDAAEAFAKAAPREDVRKLPAYVASRRGKPTHEDTRRALGAAIRAAEGGDMSAAVVALQQLDTPEDSILGAKIAKERGLTLGAANRGKESVESLADGAGIAERLGWIRGAGEMLHFAVKNATSRGDTNRALALAQRRMRLEASRGSEAGLADAAADLGIVFFYRGEHGKAKDGMERALSLFEKTGDRAGVSRTLIGLGAVSLQLGETEAARSYQQRALALAEDLNNKELIGVAVGNLAEIHRILGNLEKSLELQRRSLALAKETSDRFGEADCLTNIGNIHIWLGDYVRARDCIERALSIHEELANVGGVSRALCSLGVVYDSLSLHEKALECHRRTLELAETSGRRVLMASALSNLGLTYESQGDFANAFAFQQRALELAEELREPGLIAGCLRALGSLHTSLGNHEQALGYLERALALAAETKDQFKEASVLVTLGNIRTALGEFEQARADREHALALYRKLQNEPGIAAARGALANTYQMEGKYEKALACYQDVLKSALAIHQAHTAVAARLSVAEMHWLLGQPAKALEESHRAQIQCGELGLMDLEARGCWIAAGAHLAFGRPAEAASAARRGIEELAIVSRGLAEEQGALARSQWAPLMEHGIRAAVNLRDANQVSFFLESGRAGMLMESLGNRERLREVVLPESLQEEERGARAELTRAQADYERAKERGNRKRIREADSERAVARRTLLELLARIQRTEKAAAEVAYSAAASTKEIQSVLEPGDALVFFALLDPEAIALVVTNETTRIVSLPQSRLISSTLESVRLQELKADPTRSLDVLREMLVTPLALEPSVKRVIVSPPGELAYLPFALLLEGRDVAYAPSGSTYVLLRKATSEAGNSVLALGDPQYGKQPRAEASALFPGRAGLSPLPGTRLEAKAVGDVTLLGAEANERRLTETLRTRERWRSVHLACHGLVDPERPLLSSLALTPSENEDGFLMTLDVFRMRIPADLVVLSACETGRGKSYASEGIVGFTRAFLFAGASRVIVSLWKVDDDSTRALMTKFYELWKCGRVPTAEALRRAQAFVASHAKWHHPYYWAAWQLWGRAD